jgi:hypothetical protein
MHYIVPIALEGYKAGYMSMVQDEYERVITIAGNGHVKSKDWVLKRRVRIFSKPAHYGLDGQPFRCEECEEHWAKVPQMADEVIPLLSSEKQ